MLMDPPPFVLMRFVTTKGWPRPVDHPSVLRAAGLCRGGRLCRRSDIHDPAATLRAELDLTLDKREQRVVTAPADAITGMEMGTPLADDDLAGVDQLAAEALDAQALRVRVPPVAGG